jgi:hypothetical protein
MLPADRTIAEMQGRCALFSFFEYAAIWVLEISTGAIGFAGTLLHEN